MRCWAFAPLVFAIACLPEDTRPTPGKVSIVVEGDDALAAGFTTADGYAITFERFLVSLGNVELEGDDCTSYNEVDYLRLVELRLGVPQKLSTPYARGACDFAFELTSPAEDVVLGEGVSASDAMAFRVAGLSLLVMGVAQGAGGAVRFAWGLRGGLRHADCGVGDERGLNLASGDDQSVTLTITSETLFAASPAMDAERRFAPYAEADALHGNADGEVSLDELAASPAPPGASGFADLGEWLERGVVPRLPRFQGTGSCDASPIDDD